MATAAPLDMSVPASPAAAPSARMRHARLSPWAAFRTFWPLVSGNRTAVLVSALLLVVSAGCDAGAIGIAGQLTDDVLTPGDLSAFWDPAALWLGLAAVGAVTSTAGGYLSGWTSEHFLLGLRDRVFRHLQQLPPDGLDRYGTGDLVSRLTGDVEVVETLIASAPVELLTSAVGALVFAAAALRTSWQLALITFAAAPLIWIGARVFGTLMRSATREERDSNGRLASLLEESLANMPVVQAYSRQEAERAKVHREGRDWMRAGLRQIRLSSVYGPLGELLETVSVLTVIGAGAWQISAHHLSVGGLLAFSAYLGYLHPRLQELGELVVGASSATAACERLIEILRTTPTAPDTAPRPDVPLPTGPVCGAVTFEDVGFAYPGGLRPVLHGVRLDVPPGLLVAVTGPSGAGKSTLVGLLLRFYEPSRGRILLDGLDIAALPVDEVRRHITLLPQESMLFDGTVRENIVYGRPDATDADVWAAAAAADAHDFVTALPDGYDTPVGRRGNSLSGGQRRRIALARAMLRTAPVLVLDEPTAGLDDGATARVMAPLRRLAAGRTTFLITHDLRLTAQADLILHLADGTATSTVPGGAVARGA
ncbi:ATP-binding cassette subfamily B protein [Streptomyces sp. Ag109_O5-1]|uniref:ABC transporter ATP-binding protein n=1 Tax=Streptomyces sp. Ag109_O5-1 TaxID=1938851 RepID=UPI000FACC1E6|nr:ABC transporter ATP-binding protein [Streptomyces sp. Ag109_O5-1]RPE37271.1 ATP-binding cassette subfamily B protein [Streptomyces sp. Ag109_O5-1]